MIGSPNIALGFNVIRVKKTVPFKEHGLAYNVMNKLLKMGQYLNKGYHLFVIKFFLSLPLAKYLSSQQTYVTETLRRNSKGILNRMKIKFGVSEETYMRNENLLILGYREKASQKKFVLLLSTKAKAKSIEKVKVRRIEEIIKLNLRS